jgi:hypothetical protein
MPFAHVLSSEEEDNCSTIPFRTVGKQRWDVFTT